MAIICPTVTANDLETFNQQLVLVDSFAERIHLDVMDGVFAPTLSPALNDIALPAGKIVDIHVMFRNPESLLDRLIKMQPNLVIVHAESKVDIPLFATMLRENGIQTGVALLPDTTSQSINYILPHVQHVLIFGGHLGYHGGRADLTQLAKAIELKKLHPHLELGWDGGANPDNIGQIAAAGIDVINVGSAIHKSDSPETTYATMKATIASV